MLRLVEANFTSAGKTDLCDRAPSRFLQVRDADTLLSECGDLGLQVVTHEKEFVPLKRFGGMNGHFCRRQREDQPSMAGGHRGKSEDVPTERAISRRILAVEDYMRTKDHERCLFAEYLTTTRFDGSPTCPTKRAGRRCRFGLRPSIRKSFPAIRLRYRSY